MEGVTIDGELYEGCGPTKQKAKYNAAKAALRKALLLTVSCTRGVGRQSRRPSAEGQVQRRQGCTAEGVTIDGELYEGCGPTKQKAKYNAAIVTPSAVQPWRRCTWPSALSAHTPRTAHRQVQRRQGCTAEGVTIDGELYEGCGPTKQKAKYNAAKADVTIDLLLCALRKTLLLTVSCTRGVGRQSRRPSTTPPRLHCGRRYY